MQYCSADVSLYGQEGAVIVPKEDLSIPEIALMRHLHGEDAVKNIQPTHVTREPMISFKAKLLDLYRGSPATQKVIETLWPGLNPALPKALEDIGLQFDPTTMGSREKKPRAVTVADLGVDEPDEVPDDGSTYAAEDAAAPDDADPAAVGAALARRVGKSK